MTFAVTADGGNRLYLGVPDSRDFQYDSPSEDDGTTPGAYSTTDLSSDDDTAHRDSSSREAGAYLAPLCLPDFYAAKGLNHPLDIDDEESSTSAFSSVVGSDEEDGSDEDDMDEADDGVSDPVPFDAAFDSMVDLQLLDIDGMLTAFGCHPMQSSMDNWSSLEEDESLFDNNGFSGVFSDVEEEGSREDDSTDVEAEVQRGEEEFMSMFTNGLGADDRQAGSFTRRFETAITEYITAMFGCCPRGYCWPGSSFGFDSSSHLVQSRVSCMFFILSLDVPSLATQLLTTA